MLQDFVKQEFTAEELETNRKREMEQAYLEEAGLEDRDIQKLRKTMLSAEEAIAARSEQIEDARQRKSRKSDWDEYIDAKRRWGRALHHSELISCLRSLVPNLYVCDGVMKHKDGSIDIGIYTWDKTQPFRDKIGGTVYLGYLHQNWNPEYEIDVCDEHGIAIRKLRGWRTTVMNMICRRDEKTFYPKSLFREDDAYDVFGYPTNGATSSNFRQQLWRFRNTSPERAKLEHQLLQSMRKYS